MTDKAVGAAGSPTSSSSFSTPVMRTSPSDVPSEDVDAISSPIASCGQQQTPKTTGSRKRVFTFQKRWLHSLPIVERSLPDAEMDGRVVKAVRTTSGASAAAADKHKDVIVCMLCDDPASKRELTKVWSRLNCRRGRIENHLMSKHPEFMRLLKHKREAEGDLAVQIFLQNLREGRCNARTEINNGLYSQLQTLGSRSSPAADHSELQKRALGDYINVRDDLEGDRKRAKLETSPVSAKDSASMAASVYSAGGMMLLRNGALPHAVPDAADGVDGLTSNVLYQDTLATQWQSVFFNKLVVITGGDNRAMAAVATQLWLSGANVLLAFKSMSALDEFNATHIGRFPDPSESEDTPRGVMLPVLESFRTQKDIAEWCGSIASKYQRVDFLINYAGSEAVEATACTDKHPSEDPVKSDPIVSSAALIEALSGSMSSTCFPGAVTSEEGWLTPSNGTIVNVAPARDDADIAPLIKSLAAKLQPRNVQVNCVLLPPRQPDDVEDTPDDVAALSHSILFLLSPSSRLLSGSVLRLHPDKSPAASADRRADAPASEAVINSHSI
ncbi:uncharacterized protein KRP23_253 [Phytophthora ramorum]|uniref:Uncharacterized protein n=1 Tax=Phytophthora ramorum TaxID=164328 RepID=H3GN29_PHYRM|nr:hypothetical protein KRP23_253 [Phytophthora ramorum]